MEAAGIPEPLQEAAFRSAVALIANAGTDRPGDRNDRSLRDRVSEQGDGSNPGSESPQDGISIPAFFDRLSSESGVAIDELRQVLHIEGNALEVVAPTRQLGSTKCSGTQFR